MCLIQLTGIAKFRNGSIAEDKIPLSVTILDENDNAPYFEIVTGNITEASETGNLLFFLQSQLLSHNILSLK